MEEVKELKIKAYDIINELNRLKQLSDQMNGQLLTLRNKIYELENDSSNSTKQ